MTPERFRQVEQLAILALEQDESERTEFLDNACSGDGELRREVESLLASDEKAGDFLEHPAAELVAERLPSTASVGRYIIERELGSGGMGVVYAAYDPELGRKLAIKLVRPATSARIDPSQGRARLLREAQAMAQVTHPNVVSIHDVGTFGDQVFIAMEYVEGSTLTEWLSNGRRTWRDIVSIFAQAGRGLAAAHAKNIVHRDFKADNVWVGEDGRARVLDFGLARAIGELGEQRSGASPERSPRVPMLGKTVTRSGGLVGTPPYMAPEQLRGEAGDARSDQFSFCVALYLALYGGLPFTGDTVAALLEDMHRRKLTKPAKSNGVPSSVRRALLRGLSPDPADRYGSMEGLLEDLAPRRQISRRHLLVPAILATAVIALVVARIEWRGRDGAGGFNAVAVLPLKNLSGDGGQDYFADGITEALITELGKIAALRVLSYQSVIGYRQTAKPLPQIAQELKVDAFLEGAVLHSGERAHITAKLIQASPERQLWAESYEFNLSDVMAVQAEVARDVAKRIRVNLTPAEQVRLSTSRRVDSEAYQAYLLGRAHLSRIPSSATNWARAKEYLEKAIDKDPGYAPAYAALAELQMRHRGSSTRHPADARRQARRWAEKALQLDDTVAEAHNALARVAQQEWDWAGAERAFRRAIDLNPSYPVARINYVMFLYAMLRFDEAAAEAERAQQVDPSSPLVNTWAGAAYYFAGRVSDAMASWQKALELDPTYADASLVLARTYVTDGKYKEAIGELRKALIFNERHTLIVGALAHAHALAGQRDEALKLLGELKRIEAEERGYVPPFGLIWAYAALGDKEQAFAVLEKSYEERRDRMVWLNVDPLLDPLRSDPRFDDLVRRVGLPTSSTATAQ